MAGVLKQCFSTLPSRAEVVQQQFEQRLLGVAVAEIARAILFGELQAARIVRPGNRPEDLIGRVVFRDPWRLPSASNR